MTAQALEEPVVTDVDLRELGSVRLTVAEYLAMWGSDRDADGCAFYNYSIEGDSLEYLEEQLLPALARLLKQEWIKPSDYNNLVVIKDYIASKIQALKETGTAPPVVREDELLTLSNGTKLSYGAVRAKMGEFFEFALTLVAQTECVRAALHQGIDGRLQACFVPERGDEYRIPRPGVLAVRVSAVSFPVLLRRLTEMPNRTARRLALNWCRTLGLTK